MTINLSKLEKAIALHGNNQLDIAEKIYEDILASDGKDFNALYLLGTIKAQKNKNEEAILLIKKSLSINPNNFIAYSNLGLIYYNINKLEEAERFVATSVYRSPRLRLRAGHHY